MSGPEWGGRRVTEARAFMAQRLPAPCGQCGETVHPYPERGWVVGHIVGRGERPDLTWVPSNWQPEHRACSDKTGQAGVIAKAKREALAGVFPGEPLPAQPPPLPFSLPVEPRGDLAWTPETLSDHPWLRGLLDVPADASPPLYMTPPPVDAVGSYALDCSCGCGGAIAWIEANLKIRLRWWQRLAITRQLEYRAEGTLVHRTVIESCPRRAGKSVRIRGLALWRLAHATLLGEVQTVVHTGSDVAICREIQRGAWRWAESTWGSKSVAKANGKESVESPNGDRWLVRAQDAVYGYDVGFGIVDEAWNVKPDTVSEGLEPATLERCNPQLHLTSTAHRRATSLMRSHLVAAFTVEEPETLLLVWAAPHGSDPADPKVWRAASPHWSEDRRRLITSKYEKAAAGQIDPEADDLDPIAGFAAQYLNVWRLSETRAERGTPVIEDLEWGRLIAPDVPLAPPDAAAVESWFGAASLTLAWDLGGKVLVAASDHADLPAAVEALRESGFTGTATIGASLLTDPCVKGLRTRKGEGRTIATVQTLQRLLRQGEILHDGGKILTDQVLGLRTLPGSDGPRMASSGRADAVKGLVWCAAAIRTPAAVGKPRILTPTTT